MLPQIDQALVEKRDTKLPKSQVRDITPPKVKSEFRDVKEVKPTIRQPKYSTKDPLKIPEEERRVEGIAKEAPNKKYTPPPKHEEVSQPVIYKGVPLTLVEYFDVDIRAMSDKTVKQINEIYEFLPDGNMGDKLVELRKVERKLGQPTLSETRYGRIWNYLKISRNIGNLKKQREALHG